MLCGEILINFPYSTHFYTFVYLDILFSILSVKFDNF